VVIGGLKGRRPMYLNGIVIAGPSVEQSTPTMHGWPSLALPLPTCNTSCKQGWKGKHPWERYWEKEQLTNIRDGYIPITGQNECVGHWPDAGIFTQWQTESYHLAWPMCTINAGRCRNNKRGEPAIDGGLFTARLLENKRFWEPLLKPIPAAG